MSVLAGPVFALAGLLGAAGVLKLARPDGTRKALRAAGLPDPVAGVWVLALAEIVLAVAAVVYGNRLTSTLLTVAYLGFAVFAARLVQKAGAAASCGCFGIETAPATSLHVGVNVVAAAVCGASVAAPTGGIADVLGAQPLAGVPFLVLTALCGWLVYALLTLVPDLQLAIAELDGADDEAGGRS
ncbi:MAG: hypothetical protein MUF83_11060 [Acidimicrobiales bacterium]|jgi:hypothetical protein|nr:hypothetical protein [Acidimicrobiales bacterium]